MVSLGLQKETLGVLEAPILVVSLPEHCTSHCPGSGAEAARSIPALGQGRSCLLQGSFSSFHSGLIALVSQELLMHMQMLQGAYYPEWTPQTLWVLNVPRGAQQLLHMALKIRARRETKREASHPH